MTRVPAQLAAKIIDHLRGYAIITLTADATVHEWLGDADRITGYTRKEAIGMPVDALYTSADSAAGVYANEVEAAHRDGMAENSRWHCRKDGNLFWGNGLALPLNEGPAVMMKIFRDETVLKKAEDQRVLLLNELNHRVKNTLATVQSVAEQTLRSAGVDAAVRHDLGARLIALSRAHDVLVNQNWAGADLDVIVREVVGPYQSEPSPFSISGPLTRLHPSQAVTLSLVLHELAVNAVKHGALSVPQGRVPINWNVAIERDGGRSMTLLWCETDGPPVVTPQRRGFGSRLIRSAFSDHHGAARVNFEPGGLECVLVLRLVDEAPATIMAVDGRQRPEPRPSGAV